MKKLIACLLVLTVVSSILASCGKKVNTAPKAEKVNLNLGELISETEGNKDVAELNFASENEMLANMQLACENEKFELYYSPDNMSVALKEKESGNIVTTNPYNAALDQNYSGNVANRLNSQVVLTYLEEEKSLVEMYSSTDCADLGQYKIKTYENGLVFDLSIGEEKDGNNVPKVLSKERYKEICSAVDEFDVELLEMYYVLYKNSELKDNGIYDLYPDLKTKEDLYYCNLELSERETKKLSALFEDAGYTKEKKAEDDKKLNLGKSTESYPNFKFSLNYSLTDSGIKVTIPNNSIKYNSEFPLLKISLLPYFGADEASADAAGYLFIPDGTGAVINMNQNEPNRRTIITGKVYGENASKLPAKNAVEKTQQYYLPVFGTVRNNGTAIFGIITNGDANSEITALLGRPNGNYYTTYPEFTISDHERYTKVSVVENAWSNKEMYLYDKNIISDDLSVEYTFLKDEKANYSSMAEVYRNYLFKEETASAKKAVMNIETLGAVLTTKSFLGFQYEDEAVLTSFNDNIEMLKYLKNNNADKISLQLRGWQKDGLDAGVSNKVRISNALGGKKALNKLIEYCNNEKVDLSIYNNISFVKSDKAFDGFNLKKNATRTLELQLAKNAKLSPDTMLYDDGSFVVKASKYNEYLTGLVSSADKFKLSSLNMGELGNALSADYTKDNSINRGEALRYIKQALENNSKVDLSFEGGNAYVLPYASTISYISNDHTAFLGETAAVPFLQMVIGDNAVYTSEPINSKENTRYELLKCIESGTVPTYLLSYDNTSSLKVTEYTSYFKVDYEILKEEVLESYKYTQKVFDGTKGTSVVSHEILADGVTVSTYANGVKVYVNKSNTYYDAEDVSVAAMDYMIKE